MHPGKYCYLFVFLILAATTLPAAEPPDWVNLAVLQRNREPAHATLALFPDVDMATRGDKWQLSWMKSLNGEWRFHWVRKPADRPVEFYREDFDTKGF